jgi:hypothetical protein
MAASLLLDTVAWDLCLDAKGNIALASDPYAIAQNVATACRLFQGELYYDTTKGVPYWEDVYNGNYPVQLLKADLEAAALAVDGVTGATVYIGGITDRALVGQIQVQTAFGTLYASL